MNTEDHLTTGGLFQLHWWECENTLICVKIKVMTCFLTERWCFILGKDYWAKWIKYAGIRAVKTMAQVAVSLITTNAVGITDVDWIAVGSASALAGIASLLTSLAGIPEVEKPEVIEE